MSEIFSSNDTWRPIDIVRKRTTITGYSYIGHNWSSRTGSSVQLTVHVLGGAAHN